MNEYISFNKLKLKKNINNFINNYIIKLEFELDIDKIKLEKINNTTKKAVSDFFGDDHQIYLSMNENHCTYKYKKGKYEGRFCCKQITKNGNKNKYICTKHNKDHVPKKRIKKDVKNTINSPFKTTDNINLIGFSKNNNYKKDYKKIIKKYRKYKKNKIIVYGEINFNNILTKLLT